LISEEARSGADGKQGLRKMNWQGQFTHTTRRIWAIFRLAVRKYFQIDGTEWAGAFAFNAFFSLFPLMVLLVTIASVFIARDRAATEVIAYVETYVPIAGDMRSHIFDTVAGVIEARGQAGVVAFFILVWVTLQCFTTLVSATNRAWGTARYNWWRLPLKSLVLLGITAGAVLLGIGVPMLAQIARDWLFPMDDFRSWVYALAGFFIPLVMVFTGLSLFYRLAPRRPTRLSEVWAAALCATVLLLLAESLFVIYLRDFATLNAVYGAFGGIMALLLWIYLSASIFIFGACLCAAQAEEFSASAETVMARRTATAEAPRRHW
jgi:YihY family inner membrane protein